jgi:hypothetical protein
MTTPRIPKVITKPTKDPKLAGKNGMTFRSIENIPAANAIGRENCAGENHMLELNIYVCLEVLRLPS